MLDGWSDWIGAAHKVNTMKQKPFLSNWKTGTLLVHAGVKRTEVGETSEALFLNSAYVFDSAEHAQARFARQDPGYYYGRYSNPSLEMLEERLALLEGAERCIVMASGMAAVFASLMCQLRSGDHLIANKILFSSCYYIVTQILPRFGVTVTLVDGPDLAAWKAAFKPNTACVFIETPANPTLEIIDIAEVSQLCRTHGAKLIVDNVFATPILQHPLKLGADLVVYSTTKHMEGQGRTLGGAILGSKDFIESVVLPFHRHTGPHMSPFNAWITYKGIETLSLRLKQHCSNAAQLAEFLENNKKVSRVFYPGLPSHPQFAVAQKQMKNGGPMIAFELHGGREAAFHFLNRLQLIDISNNLGDTKSLINHPASSTHASISAAERETIGISENLIRFSVGIEDASDLQADLEQALRIL